MKIVLINGSPKVGGSSSRWLLSELRISLSQKEQMAEIAEIEMHTLAVAETEIEELCRAQAWVFACPLYVDGIPSHLLSCLMQLEREQERWQNLGIRSFGIVNCGFYEGIQAETALEIFENWCAKAGVFWGGGIGVGGGGGLAQMPDIKNGHGPKAPIRVALCELADQILQGGTMENVYRSVAFPRFLYKMAAQMGWRQMIKANGKKVKALGEKPESFTRD